MITSPANRPGESGESAPTRTWDQQDGQSIPGRISDRFSTSWKRFSASRPGRRFQDRYAYRKSLRRQRSRRLVRSHWLRKIDLARVFYLGAGLILICLSALGGWLPVLGWGTVFLGLGLIAGEFRPAARLMDWLEVKGRKVGRPLWEHYLNAPRWLQVVLPVTIAFGTFAFVAWSLMALFG
ncbi:Hypothetical Protein RradSPS_2280 [Rubrobacter radiotolerans]|uniref:Transmembrane protein (PGPGW) n=1 Tax=Rubrobacter radiotolerans TaxID=42256 RepID=A0A023X5I8_RUBRA|nr:hypothetical protein [Rubrobacter radiotolerans]AHY47563.1 Hypothetical Protein RradSPS_2280 [Rubrobacter radiotolerans]MDX5894968.1 hypothetical protein [Rubrobacter radiotolerans]SMC07161.1 hypothetical protein SAMN00767673_2283 [Rubrobacter radiotolerans DSM 5868]